ncbi:hypothetical protein EKO04_009742 [Ascochyta lentis]|uniref:Uncharacterized protein n=1 Tax=Ascochyta lentis TaxID=205686 RepID=A0A8H7MDV4_9PLEO|nr:hypothetical protein EKO04_009742 [Ascochyta lentis]
MDESSTASPGLNKGAMVQVSQVSDLHSFTGMPREIRDMVYHELWEQTPHMELPKNRNVNMDSFEICYNSRTPDGIVQAGLPQWLYCSTATMKEGLKQLFTRAKWSLFWEPKSRLDHRSCHRVWYSNVTNLTLRTLEFHTFRGAIFLPPIVRVLTPWPDFIAPSQIVKLLPNLKALTLNAGHRVPKPLLAGVSTRYVVQIPWFDKFTSHLESFAVHCTAESEFDLRAAAPALRIAYEAEVRRIGVLMIGEEGRLISDETLVEDPEAKEGIETKFTLKLDVLFQKRRA